MKWVVVTFLIFAVVTTGAFVVTEPDVDADDRVVVAPGENTVVDLTVRNAGTIHAVVVGAEGDSTAPRVHLPDSEPTSSTTAAVPAAGEVEPRLIVEAPENAEPGEYRLRLEAWRLPDRTGDKTVTEVTVVVEDRDG